MSIGSKAASDTGRESMLLLRWRKSHVWLPSDDTYGTSWELQIHKWRKFWDRLQHLGAWVLQGKLNCQMRDFS